MKEIEWLAGRGYNTLGVSFPAVFEGEVDRATGSLLTVLWENLTDPILTGREELGFSKNLLRTARSANVLTAKHTAPPVGSVLSSWICT